MNDCWVELCGAAAARSDMLFGRHRDTNPDRALAAFGKRELFAPVLQNNIFIAMCNRVGGEGGMQFSGESVVVAPDGSVVAQANDDEQTLLADIDLGQVAVEREKRPYLRLRRPECFQPERGLSVAGDRHGIVDEQEFEVDAAVGCTS